MQDPAVACGRSFRGRGDVRGEVGSHIRFGLLNLRRGDARAGGRHSGTGDWKAAREPALETAFAGAEDWRTRTAGFVGTGGNRREKKPRNFERI